ncbi:MAG: hypothetical protein QM698_12250 [Micropepsaceae bacterium]
MTLKLIRAAVLGFAALLGAGAALAEEEEGSPEVSLAEAVPGHPGVTYEALVKQVLPDLKPGAEGRWATDGVTLRKSEGEAEPSGPGELGSVDAFTYRAGGRDLMLIVIGDFAGQGWLHIVAVFDPAANGAPKLIDAVNVGIDRLTLTRSFLFLSPDETALVFESSYPALERVDSATQVVLLHEGKLKRVLLERTNQLMGCGLRVEQNPALEVVEDGAAPYGAISYTVTQTVQAIDEDCAGLTAPDARPGTQTFTDVFHWDAATATYLTATNNRAGLVTGR